MSVIADVPVGNMGEGDNWQIIADVGQDGYRSSYPNRMVMGVPAGQWSDWSSHPCPHASEIRYDDVRYYPGGGKFNSEEHYSQTRGWTVPRSVRSYNEAGHNCTDVCLDCILDWAASAT